MNTGDKISKEILLGYLDGSLNSVQRDQVKAALQNDGALNKQLEELRAIDKMLSAIKLDQPSKNFTASVLKRLDEAPSRSGLSIRNGIFLLAGIMVIVGVALVLLSMGVFDQTTTTLNPNDIELVQQYVPKSLPSISIDGKLIVNVIVILNLAIMFVVLDRAILRPFFERRLRGTL